MSIKLEVLAGVTGSLWSFAAGVGAALGAVLAQMGTSPLMVGFAFWG